MKKLVVFDLDDTLFKIDHSKLTVNVVDQSNTIVETIPYNQYKLAGAPHKPPQDNLRYCFKQFESSSQFATTATPNDLIISMLQFYAKQPNTTVEILTARSDFDCVNTFGDFLKEHGIDIYITKVRRAGNLKTNTNAADRKYIILKQQLISNKYDEVLMFDDCKQNIAMLDVLQNDFPSTTFKGVLV